MAMDAMPSPFVAEVKTLFVLSGATRVTLTNASFTSSKSSSSLNSLTETFKSKGVNAGSVCGWTFTLRSFSFTAFTGTIFSKTICLSETTCICKAVSPVSCALSFNEPETLLFLLKSPKAIGSISNVLLCKENSCESALVILYELMPSFFSASVLPEEFFILICALL